ncbi:synaptophysin [Hyalella azteca]|uniref:Synaptophysin n=1 Tax=Hyalella azteca TaxID=294128 RepID=A0A8B7PGM6_HYAAZ|nr:synaptophysin [Hyalella azteca]
MDSAQQPMPMQYDMQPPPVYMEQPPPTSLNMQVFLQLVANMNWQVVKEPRGFMKILQFLFTICAFATTTSYAASFSFVVKCSGLTDSMITGVVQYDFRLDHLHMRQKVCGVEQNILVSGDASSDAQFFVAVGVLAWLYVIAALILYTIFSPMYAANPLLPVIDCGMHALFAVLYLASSSAWANSLSMLKHATSFDTLVMENPHLCPEDKCFSHSSPAYGKLDVSIILGFLNLFLFASNIWFLYKETSFFQAMKQQQQQQQDFAGGQQPGVPPQTLPQQY